MGRFRLRLRATEINLPIGDVLIGRGPECFLRINEPLVSRRHARLRVSADRVLIEDLGSRNGSQVNGISVSESVLLTPGDLLTIGSQHFTLEYQDAPYGAQSGTGTFQVIDRHRSQPSGPVNIPLPISQVVSGPTQLRAASSLPLPGSSQSGRSGPWPATPGTSSQPGTGETALPGAMPDAVDPTGANRSSSYRLFWALSDKVLALGRVEEAERMMGPRLDEMLLRAEADDVPDESTVAEIAARGLRLAGATRHERWFGWIFAYARACRFRLTLPVLDEIYALMFACRPPVGQQILLYAQSLDDESLILRLVALRKLCRE